ncbi:uncharacterized protein LOC134775805 [Penaeus indicus]|uniref:uncharacterized protein LOC134775805 n=1 Tax=Penaeus indicus TaxID=29960 RepID=UPI00300DB6FD
MVKNYCHISLLLRIITCRLITHLENNYRHNTSQYGFCPHRRAESTQINFILQDVSKVFDKVWHDGLKYKLTLFQLLIHHMLLFCSFLDYRIATICLDTHLGTQIHPRSGIPQKSVLSLSISCTQPVC